MSYGFQDMTPMFCEVLLTWGNLNGYISSYEDRLGQIKVLGIIGMHKDLGIVSEF